MQYAPKLKEYWLVTLERYATNYEHGQRTFHRFADKSNAKSFVDVQLSTGAFARFTLDHVTTAATMTWEQWAEHQSNDGALPWHETCDLPAFNPDARRKP